MIVFKHSQTAYNANVKNLHVDRNVILPSKFDTGAGVTIFSVLSTNGRRWKLEKDFIGKLKKNKIPVLNVKSATFHEMPCIARCKKNVEIGSVKFDYFYYYWFLSTDIPKELIGDDFIKFCDVRKSINGDFIVNENGFDMDGYMAFHRSEVWKDAIAANEIIDEMLESDNMTK